MVRARTSSRSPSQRQLRVGELLRHALSDILSRGDVHDPQLAKTPVTVTEVRTSPDLRHGTAFVAPLGGQGGDEILDALRRNAAYLRGQVSRQVKLKFSPELSFELDKSFDHAARIGELLRDQELQAPGPQVPDNGREK